MTRSTGVLLSVYIAFFLGNAFLERVHLVGKALKTVLTTLLCVAIMFAPVVVVIYTQPYLLHCDLRTRTEWTGTYPKWCAEKLPNVYAFIQLLYWDNQFLGFLYRKAEHVFTAAPMNIIYTTVVSRVASANPAAFFSLGIFGRERTQDGTVLDSFESVPHAWYMTFQLTLVFLYANQDINSRVASTLPFYYWAFAALVLQKRVDSGMSKLARFACLHNLVYLALNLLLFPPEIGFF